MSRKTNGLIQKQDLISHETFQWIIIAGFVAQLKSPLFPN